MSYREESGIFERWRVLSLFPQGPDLSGLMTRSLPFPFLPIRHQLKGRKPELEFDSLNTVMVNLRRWANP